MSDTLTLTQKKRNAIVHAASEAFMQQGFDATSMDFIAKLANVSKRTVYNHFASKELLFKAVLKELLEYVQQINVSYDAHKSLKEQLLEIAKKEAKLYNTECVISLFRIAMLELMRNPDGYEDISNEFSIRESNLYKWLAAATQDKRLDIEDLSLAAEQFKHLLKGALFWPQVLNCKEHMCTLNQEKHIDETVEMFLARYSPKA